ncbi:MAG TPA: hypothetical protein VF281_02535, partial [Candidatus Saccharimonadales bacterium]
GLDRGELDKILERSAGSNTAPAVEARQDYVQEPQHQEYRSSDQRYKHKKKESFLGDLFDF